MAPSERSIQRRDVGEGIPDNDLLASLGYKSEFKREFSLLETIAFAFSIMGVIAGVSSTLSFGLAGG
ncbi:hypothetical protein AAF712_013555 [Marasmius tenuissimus]|uniref:Uncharacterized protein n=1 Tax=Marasmius tenuissimus TaxID=585030 RepID=A0ABR2ZEL8_9AGAR